MSVEFRQRKPGEYAAMLWRRKWLIALPAAAIGLAVAWAVLKLPNVYESQTLLTIRPPSISPSIVPQLSSDDLSIRINGIGQEVVSRSSLQPLIEKHNLYAAERQRGEAMDVLVERMRTRDISVKLNTTRNDVTNGFFLTFRSADPKTAQAVTAELASKYTRAQATSSQNDAQQTKEFFERRLQEEKQKLDAIDQRRLQAMTKNMAHLPSQMQALVGQLSGLREEQKSLNTSLDLLRERRASLTRQQADVAGRRGPEIEAYIDNIQDPKTTPAYAALVSRREQLKSEKENLLTTLRPKHPDVVSKQAEIESVQREINDLIEDWKQRVEARRKRLESLPDDRLNNLRAELSRTEAEIGTLQKRLAANDQQVADINRNLSGIPGAEVELESINREYQTAKAVYDGVLEQSEKAKIISDVQANAQGETIAVIDAANLPEQPVAPKRPVLMLLGLCAGLFVGLAFAAAFEVPRLLTIQSREDAEHYTGLPVLVSLPEMRTLREERRLRARRVGLALAGVALAVIAVPGLAFLLHVTHALEVIAFRG